MIAQFLIVWLLGFATTLWLIYQIKRSENSMLSPAIPNIVLVVVSAILWPALAPIALLVYLAQYVREMIQECRG